MDLDVFSNYMSNSAVGIKLSKCFINTQSHRGNQFYGPFSTADIDAQEVEDIDLPFNKFEIDASDGTVFWPEKVKLVPGSMNTLVSNLLGATQTCNGSITPTIRLLSLCDRIRAIQNNPNIDARRKAAILAHYFNLIKKHYPNPEDWPSCIQIFMGGFFNTNVEKMSEVQILRDSIFSFAAVQNSSWSSNVAPTLDSYLQAVSTNTNVASAQQAYWDEVGSVSNSFSGFNARNESIITQMESIMSSFAPTNAYEEAWEVSMQGWITDYNGDELTSTERIAIEAVAGLCPLYYGSAVHAARALVTEWNSHRFDKDDECEEVYIRSKSHKIDQEVGINPNPTTGLVHLSNVDNGAKITIFDALGNQILHKTVDDNVLDLSIFKDGIYMVKIKSDDIVQTKQIIKIQ